jgi:archaellum component FlaC
MRNLLTVITLLVIIGLGLFYFNPIKDIFWPVKPCSRPLEFSIGTFDSQFGVSQAKFMTDINQAGQVWSKALGKSLFEYNASGGLKINLIYDKRQQVTNELKQADISINGDKSAYNILNSQYISLVSDYKIQKANYENQLADFNAKQADYNKQVDYWNTQGGAPAKEYATLEKEKVSLNDEASTLNKTKDSLNSLVNQINDLVPTLNNLAQKLNLKVATFNNISSSNGESFNEGEYVQDSTGPHINIYQFDNNNQLVRVLEHELGHSLGLEHISDPKAVMYYLNSGQSEQLTAGDVAELRRVCD